jgi:hypothetical protein
MSEPDADTRSLDALIDALYASMSFGVGAAPDYVRFAALFAPSAVVMPPNDDGLELAAMDLERFVASSRAALAAAEDLEGGLSERELHRRTERFGALAQVFSSYETRLGDGQPLGRGVNALQLVRTALGWRIVSLAWDDESPLALLPSRLLPAEPDPG